VLEHVPRELTITVTSSPSRGVEATLQMAEALAGAGYRVVPHLAARLVESTAHLEALLARIDSLGVREVFVVAGDIDEPRGPFEGAAALLRAMSELGHPLQEIGITGYPESHAFISDDTTIQAMFDKAPYATYIVSQICFDAAVVGEWIHRVRDRGVELPIHVGLPGPNDPVKLLALSRRIGLGESARFLRRHGSWIKRLTLPRGYSPSALLAGLAPHLAPPENRIAGLHLFTFNELAEVERWRLREIERLGSRGR
jgi:methylenetetrahydrofolate reductase (NADPH)